MITVKSMGSKENRKLECTITAQNTSKSKEHIPIPLTRLLSAIRDWNWQFKSKSQRRYIYKQETSYLRCYTITNTLTQSNPTHVNSLASHAVTHLHHGTTTSATAVCARHGLPSHPTSQTHYSSSPTIAPPCQLLVHKVVTSSTHIDKTLRVA